MPNRTYDERLREAWLIQDASNPRAVVRALLRQTDQVCDGGSARINQDTPIAMLLNKLTDMNGNLSDTQAFAEGQ